MSDQIIEVLRSAGHHVAADEIAYLRKDLAETERQRDAAVAREEKTRADYEARLAASAAWGQAAEASKDAAYEERNRLVALLATMFPSGTKQTDIPGWSADWNGCVYIDFPWGQASWHYPDSQAHLFAHLPPYSGGWDADMTEGKYVAIEAVIRLARMPPHDA